MDRDTFIITVYCVVVEPYRVIASHYPIRRGGVDPALTDEEVITMEICGEYFKLNTDQDIFDYFQAHYRPFFPTLGDRPLFVRQAANWWQIKAAIQQRLTVISGQAEDPVPSMDTLPMPVCVYTRAPRDRCFKLEADDGHGAAKDMDDYGFKLGLRIARSGMITHFPLLAARPHAINHLDALVEGFSGIVPADKGFISEYRRTWLDQRHGITLVTPRRARMKPGPHACILVKTCARWRKLVETVGSQLTERFAIARIRVRNLWHFQHRVIRKVLAHTMMVFLNLQLGRPPLDFDGLVGA